MSGIRIQFTASAFSALLLFLIAEVWAQSSVADQYGAKVSQLVNGMYPKLEDVYKDIHAHPELGFQETRTAAKLAAEMSAMGFQVTEKVGKTGVVAIFRNGPGPTVLVRTELDALPMEEKDRPPVCQHGQVNVVRSQDLRRPQLRARHSYGELARDGAHLARAEGPVAGNADVRRAARGRTEQRREGDACGRVVHAIRQTELRFRAAHLPGAVRHRGLQRGSDNIEFRQTRDHV